MTMTSGKGAVPEVQQHLEPVFAALTQLRVFAEEVAVTIKTRLHRRAFREGMLFGALSAASSSAHAAQILAMHGKAEDGMAHVRTVCEWAIRAGYVVANADVAAPLARRWFVFQRFAQLKYALGAQKLGAGDDPERLARRVVRLQKLCDRLDALLCFPGSEVWTKEPFFDPDRPKATLNLYKMAKLAGQEWLYDAVYTQGNDAAHAGPMALAIRVTGNDDDACRTLVAASVALEHLLFVADGALELGIKGSVERLSNVMSTALRGATS